MYAAAGGASLAGRKVSQAKLYTLKLVQTCDFRSSLSSESMSGNLTIYEYI